MCVLSSFYRSLVEFNTSLMVDIYTLYIRTWNERHGYTTLYTVNTSHYYTFYYIDYFRVYLYRYKCLPIATHSFIYRYRGIQNMVFFYVDKVKLMEMRNKKKYTLKILFFYFFFKNILFIYLFSFFFVHSFRCCNFMLLIETTAQLLDMMMMV